MEIKEYINMNKQDKILLKEDTIAINDELSISILTIKQTVKNDDFKRQHFYYEVYQVKKTSVKLIDKINFDYYEMNTAYQVINGYFILYNYLPVENKRWDNVTDVLCFYDINDETKVFGTIEDVLRILNLNVNDSKLRYLEIVNSYNPNYRILISDSKKKKIKCSSNLRNEDYEAFSRYSFNDYLIELKIKGFDIDYNKKTRIYNIEDYRKNRYL